MVSPARTNSANAIGTGYSRVGVRLRARALTADADCKFRVGEGRLREAAKLAAKFDGLSQVDHHNNYYVGLHVGIYYVSELISNKALSLSHGNIICR